MMSYIPHPVDTSDVVLDDALMALCERLAHNTHEVWSKGRISQGWSYGPERNDALKQTPCLVPYAELSEQEKDYDRHTAMETVKLLVKLGCSITLPEDGIGQM